MKNKIKILTFLLGLLCGVLLIAPRMVNAAESGKSFWVEYIDVGQGDSTLIQCDGHYMMIDGGPSKASSKIYTILKDGGINKIDLMIATHPDEDHIGGLSGALNYAEVDTVLSPVTSHDTKTFHSLLKYINKQGKNITVPRAGDIFTVGTAKVYIAGPIYNSSDTNNESIVVLVKYGNNAFMFMGDAEEEEENSILNSFSGLKCDVLKVGHHGSDTSTSEALLRATKPKCAVISVGTKNGYGHPTQGTIDKLTSVNAQIYRTDLQGDIIFYSDGNNLTVETQKNALAYELVAGEGKKSTKESSRTLNANETEHKYSSMAAEQVAQQPQVSGEGSYVLNTNTKKFHYPTCSSVDDMSPKNRSDVNMSREEIIAKGFVPCKRCNP